MGQAFGLLLEFVHSQCRLAYSDVGQVVYLRPIGNRPANFRENVSAGSTVGGFQGDAIAQSVHGQGGKPNAGTHEPTILAGREL